jgi:GTP cyclohydrolase I
MFDPSYTSSQVCPDDDVRPVADLLRAFGFDLNDPHMVDTPRRVARYLRRIAEGVQAPRVTLFENANPRVDQMVVVRSIRFWAPCPHHLLPYHGTVLVGYLPAEYIIGKSKVAQVVRWLASTPVVQEVLTEEIADWFMTNLRPLGVGVHVRAVHTCEMLSGGADVPPLCTTALKGVFLANPLAREEFLKEVHRGSV